MLPPFALIALLAEAGATGGLTLSRAVELGLGHQLGLRVAAVDVSVAEARRRERDEPYGTVLDASLFFEQANAASPFAPTEFQHTTQPRLTLGATKRFLPGTQLRLSVDGYWIDAEPIGSLGFGETKGTFWTFGATLTQPLLRGFGRDVGEAPAEAAEIATDTARLERRRAASQVAVDVETTYWEAVQAQAEVETRKLGVASAQRDLEDTRRRVELKTEPEVAILQVETTLAARREALLTAEQRARDTIEALSVAIGAPAPALPGDVPSPRELAAGDDAAFVTEAVAKNLELAVLSRRIEEARTSAKTEESAVKPALDLVGGANYTLQYAHGGQEPVPPFRTPPYEFRGEGYSYRIGAQLSYPLDNDGPEARLAAARLAVTRLEHERARRQSQLAAEVRAALGRRRTATERLASATTAERLAARRHELEKVRHEAGAAITRDVLEAHDALEEARLRAQRAAIDALEAQVQVEHLTGALLSRWQIKE